MATNKTTGTTNDASSKGKDELALGRTLGLGEVGEFSAAVRAHVRRWLNDNFGAGDFDCRIEELPNGGLSLSDPAGDTDEGDFAVHTLVDANGATKFVAVTFTPLGEGSIFDVEAGRVAALSIEGRLRDVQPGYERSAAAFARLVPGIAPLPDAPRAQTVVEAGGPRDVDAWRALFPEPEAQRTIDALLGGLTETAPGKGNALRSLFERGTGVSVANQPREPFEWLQAARRLFLVTNGRVEGLVLGDVRPLAIFGQLERLDLHVTPDTDLAPLGALRRLKQLHVEGAERTDWSWLGSLGELSKLTVRPSDQGAEEGIPAQVFAISGNPKLEFLEWTGNLTDLSALGPNASLRELEIGGLVSDLGPLRGFPALEVLNAEHCDLADLTPLWELGGLTTLRIAKNRVENLHGIEKLRRLAELEADYNCLSDFSPIRAWLTDESEADEWIEATSPTQLDLSSPAGRALRDDWLDLDKWRALADFLNEQGHPMGEQITLRLDNDGRSELPFYWARGTKALDPGWE